MPLYPNDSLTKDAIISDLTQVSGRMIFLPISQTFRRFLTVKEACYGFITKRADNLGYYSRG